MSELRRRVTLGCVAAVSAAGLIAVPGVAHAVVPDLAEVHVFTPDQAERAGYSVDLAGDYALYSVNRGLSVAVSHRTGPGDDAWETALLERPGGDGTSNFGETVILNETADRAFVAAPREQTIYSWSRSGTNTWTLDRTYPAPTTFARISSLSTSFGQALAISGDRLLVGAPNAVVDGKASAGAAFVLDVSGGPADGQWTALLPDPGDTIERAIAGQAVAIDGTIAMVGLPQRNVGGYRVGGVYRYDLASGGAPTLVGPPAEQSVCFPSASAGGPSFGISLAMSDGLLAVGSPVEGNQLDGSAVNCTNQAVLDDEVAFGAVYRYDYDLNPVGTKLLAPTGRIEYGYTVASSGDLLMASAEDLTDGFGLLIVHDLSDIPADESRPAPVQELVPSDSQAGDGFGGHIYGAGPAISGDAALVGVPNKRANAGSVYYFRPLGAASTLTVPDTTAEYGQTGTITVAVDHPVAGAQLDVTVNGVTRTVPVQDGTGLLEVTGLDVAEYPVLASYRSGGVELASAEATHTVTPAPTVTVVTAPATAAEGETVPVAGRLTAPYGPVRNATIELGIDGTAVRQVTTADDGTFATTLTLPEIEDDEWELEADFPGDTNDLASEGIAVTREGILADPPTPTPTPTPTPEPEPTADAPAPDPTADAPAPDPTADAPAPAPGPTTPAASAPTDAAAGPATLPLTGAGAGTALVALLAAALIAAGAALRRRSRRAPTS